MTGDIIRCFIDVETTGLNAHDNGITQISGAVVASDREEKFNYLCRPFPTDIIETSALEAQGKTVEEVMAYPDPIVVHHGLTALLGIFVDKYSKTDKCFLLAYNAPFDSQFLREWFLRCGDKYFGSWFWNPPICVMVLAGQYLMARRHEMRDFKQVTVAKALGIEVDESRLHDAEYDIGITRAIYRAVTAEVAI